MAGTVKEDSPSLRWTHCCRPLNSKCADQHNLLRSQGSVSAQQLLKFNNNTSCHVRQLGFHLESHLRRPEGVLQGVLLLLCQSLECCDDEYPGAFICAILGAFICAILGAFICGILGAFICAILGAFNYAILGAFNYA